MALTQATGSPGERPELWRLDPDQVLSVDIAGYLHVQKGEAPARLFDLALAEPERTLRAEVLAALEVRRPEVRPLLAWFTSRHAFSATVIVDEDGPLGFVLLPRANRSSVMTLEEARAVRVLCDRISALISVSSALARSRERELTATTRADHADDEVHRLEHILELGSGRNEACAARLARDVQSAAFSPAARMAIDGIERLGKLDAPLTLTVPPGTDATGWAAIAHLASSRRGGAFVLVDGSSGAEHEIERWENSETSPLSLADGGTLVLLDVSALPDAIQSHIARVFSRHASTPSRTSVLPPGLVATARGPVDELVGSGRLSPSLARWLGGSEVRVPPLSERAEDIRSLVLDQLARTGLRLRGEPFGVDVSALRVLTEHPWPGNELELRDVLERAACVVDGDVVSARHLAQVGFVPAPEGSTSATPLPVAARRRVRPRWSPRRQ